ncbi:hypothetical protein, partial [Bordetella pertussis]|uniref:hypothetical protein n=1 Tax=Bordetella pertussis TaxID=520 RepID=UPI0018A7A714
MSSPTVSASSSGPIGMLLGLGVLADGLDDQVGLRHAIALGVGNQAVEGGARGAPVLQLAGEEGAGARQR